MGLELAHMGRERRPSHHPHKLGVDGPKRMEGVRAVCARRTSAAAAAAALVALEQMALVNDEAVEAHGEELGAGEVGRPEV